MAWLFQKRSFAPGENSIPARERLAHIFERVEIRTAAILFITLLAYFPALHAGYIWDDDVTLTNNPAMRTVGGLLDIWTPGEGIDFIPLTLTSFWLEWRLWGQNPFGYHLINIVLHALNALLIWRCLVRLRVPGPWCVALLFAVHPVSVASVAWITERKNTLSTLFFLLSLWFYLRMNSPDRTDGSRNSKDKRATAVRFYWISLACFVAALLSKTAVVILPCLLLACSLWLHGKLTWRDCLGSAPFFTFSCLFGLVTIWYQFRGWNPDITGKSFPIADRLAGGGWAVWFYLGKALVPVNLSMIYPRWDIDVKSAIAYLPGLAWTIGLALCWKSKQAWWGRACLFGFGCFTLMLSPVLGVFKMSYHQHSRVADHFQYLGIIPMISLIVSSIYLIRKTQARSFLLTVAVVIFSVMTWQQSALYKNPAVLWSDTIRKNPNAWMAYNNLGVALLDEKKPADSIAMFEKTLQLKPDYYPAECSLGDALAASGRPTEALTHYNRALQAAPNFSKALNNRGILLLNTGQVTAASADFNTALGINPRDAEAHNNLGAALFQSGDVQKAIEAFSTAVKLRPSFAAAYRNLGRASLSCGLHEKALEALRKAVALNPAFADAWRDQAELFIRQSQADPAYECFRKAIRIEPNDAETHYRFGLFLDEHGKSAEAIQHWRTAVSVKTNWTEALNNLAWALACHPDASVRNGPEAVLAAESACKLSTQPRWPLLDTLAAAYAEVGSFEKATNIMHQVIGMAADNPETCARLRKRLACYESGKPWREKPRSAGDR